MEAAICKIAVEAKQTNDVTINNNVQAMLQEHGDNGADRLSVEAVELDAVLNAVGVMGVIDLVVVPDVLEKASELQDMWAVASQSGIQRLRDRNWAMGNMSVGQSMHLSLLQTEASLPAVFVHWHCPSTFRGRVADIDDSDQKSVKAIVCVRDKKNTTNFKDSTIIHPSVGTSMRRIRPEKRTKGRNYEIKRPQLKDDIVALKEMWERACGLERPQLACQFCCGNTQEQLVACALCLLTTHPNCAQTLLTHISLPPAPTFNDWPTPAFNAKARQSCP